ncbi:hypothetical protein DN748_06690 [Sinomicrobium soli]|nr:hypothetical protein DN748_06690 [Sinomicrobium sp. N-1-3-6]
MLFLKSPLRTLCRLSFQASIYLFPSFSYAVKSKGRPDSDSVISGGNGGMGGTAGTGGTGGTGGMATAMESGTPGIPAGNPPLAFPTAMVTAFLSPSIYTSEALKYASASSRLSPSVSTTVSISTTFLFQVSKSTLAWFVFTSIFTLPLTGMLFLKVLLSGCACTCQTISPAIKKLYIGYFFMIPVF